MAVIAASNSRLCGNASAWLSPASRCGDATPGLAPQQGPGTAPLVAEFAEVCRVGKEQSVTVNGLRLLEQFQYDNGVAPGAGELTQVTLPTGGHGCPQRDFYHGDTSWKNH